MLPFTIVAVACALCGPPAAAEPLRALIVDGQNKHANWPQTTARMRKWLEDSGRFTIDVRTHAATGLGPDHPITRGMPAASGAVTLPVPDDFPTADATRRRPFAD